MPWLPKPTLLRALRERMELSLERLAAQAGVNEKTIRNIEAGRTKVARTSTLRAIAAVLNADIADFARHVEPPPARWGRRRAVSASVEGPPPPRLDALVAVEYALGAKPPRIATEELGLVDPLTATMLQSIVTAHCVHEGERFVVTGRIVRQHGISPEEGAVLASAEGIGVRFLIAWDVAKGELLAVHIYATEGHQTRALQQQLGRKVSLIVRVVLASSEAGWAGFPFYGSETRRPWTLVVESIMSA